MFCCTNPWPCNGPKADFEQKRRLFLSEKPPQAQPHGGGAKAAPSVVALPLPGALPRCNAATTRDLAVLVGMAARSAVPSSGPSTPRHSITVKAGAFCREMLRNQHRRGGGVRPPGGGSALPRLRAKHPRAEPKPEQNLFLALPYLPSVLPFF